MRQKSILATAFLLVFVLLFFKNQFYIREQVVKFSHDVKYFFLTQQSTLSKGISTHFNQTEQIKALKKKVEELEPQASLSVAFASKLNHLLKETDLTVYHPQLYLVEVLGYERMQNQNRLWIAFPSFNKKKNYGLIYQGYTAGIIRNHLEQPLAVLQSSKESLFSVYIGENKIQGIAFGDGKNIKIKYIPSYENPQIGDEVISSGNDQIFYEGIKVGKVISVEKKDMYKIATVSPYVKLNGAHFFYAVVVK